MRLCMRALRSTLVLVAFAACSAFQCVAPHIVPGRVVASRTCAVRALDPLTTSAAAFGLGLLPPSLLLAGKEGELQEAKAEADRANAELLRLRAGFQELLTTLELEVDMADAALDEMLSAGTRKARQKREELSQLREKYEAQISQLKELVGDYADKVELQQNSFKRLSAIAESARSESLAMKERANVLEQRLTAANEQLAKFQTEASLTPLERFCWLFLGA